MAANRPRKFYAYILGLRAVRTILIGPEGDPSARASKNGAHPSKAMQENLAVGSLGRGYLSGSEATHQPQ